LQLQLITQDIHTTRSRTYQVVVKPLQCCVSALLRGHAHKAKALGLVAVPVTHDLALKHLATAARQQHQQQQQWI
jgi:hypothetical protein